MRFLTTFLNAFDLENYDETSLSSEQIDQIEKLSSQGKNSEKLLKEVFKRCHEEQNSIEKSEKFDKMIKKIITENLK